MYKVFHNESSLVLAGTDESGFINHPARFTIMDNPAMLDAIIASFLEGIPPDTGIAGNRDVLWPAFRRFFIEIPAAGGVVKSNKGYLFIFRRGKWDLPKGKIDEGEDSREAALREVREETGLQEITLIKELPSTWHVYTLTGGAGKSRPVLKETRWFLMEAPGDQPLVPETAEDIEQARWFHPEALDEVMANTFASLRGMIGRLRYGDEGA